MPTLPRIVDYSGFLKLHRLQSTSGGCGGFATLHAFDIQMERLQPFAPDVSYAFLSYVYNDSMGSHGPRDSAGKQLSVTRHPKVKVHGLDQIAVLKEYGCCPEVYFPSNDDPPNALWPNEKVPQDFHFIKAENYKIKSFTKDKKPSSLNELKEWLYIHGPLVFTSFLEWPASTPPQNRYQHVVTLVGYNDQTRKFKYVNSIPCEIAEKSYDYFMDRIQNDDARVSWMEIKQPASPQHFTGSIKISGLTEQGRSALTVKIGVEGKPPMVLWDRNCHHRNNPSYYIVDNTNRLTMDFPLPDYARECWPPSKDNAWYVEITDHTDPGVPGDRGKLDDIVLVERLFNSEGVCLPILNRPSAIHVPIQAGKTLKVFIPSKKKTTMLFRIAEIPPVHSNMMDFNGKLFLEYEFSNIAAPSLIPLPNKKIYIDKLITASGIEGEVTTHIGETRTGADGSFSFKKKITENGRYKAIAAEDNGKIICVSNTVAANASLAVLDN